MSPSTQPQTTQTPSTQSTSVLSLTSTDDDCALTVTPMEQIERVSAAWTGLRADVIQAHHRQQFVCRFKSRQHLLIAAEHVERRDGARPLNGASHTNQYRLSGKLTFVPAGHEFSGWQDPRVLTRVTSFTIDARGPLLDEELRFSEIDFQPRLFFSDPVLWWLTARLKEEALKGEARLQHYGDALGILLRHELVRLNNSAADVSIMRGGLTPWQQKKVADYIEANVAENVPLAQLAALVDYSQFHFARAFKRSFGMPPHRYHILRRIERAKALLTEQDTSVTSVALAVGFSETSSFSAAFRKETGVAPSEYRRGLG